MKKFATILFTVLFSVFILIIEAGIVVVKCNHSGNYKITLAAVELDNDFSCNPNHGCMEEDFYKFSPDVTLDFHNLELAQPPALVLNTEFVVFQDVIIENNVYNINNKANPTPKDFYKIFRVFRI